MSNTTAGASVRQATVADVAALAATLGEAFQDDPVMSWCYPDHGRRREILPRTFELIIEATLPAESVYVTADGVAGAIWEPPGASEDGDGDEELVAALGQVSGDDAERLFTLLELLDPKRPRASHHYLYAIGTRPGWQSKGLGSALLRPVLEACDRDRTPAYLEASSERNVALYRRHGFEVTEEVRLPAGPPTWLMWRDPR